MPNVDFRAIILHIVTLLSYCHHGIKGLFHKAVHMTLLYQGDDIVTFAHIQNIF